MATTITANGINFPDGSAGSPSIGGSDTNTGLFTGSDIVGFATGGSERLRIDASGNVNIANDSGKLQLGTSADFQFFHDGSSSRIYNSTGDLVLRSASYYLNSADGSENIIKGLENGAVEIYHNGSKKFETTSSGGTLYGDWLADASFLLADNDKIKLGNAADLQIYHNGTNSYVRNSTGQLLVGGSGGNLVLEALGDVRTVTWEGESMIEAKRNGAVELYHDNTKRFETTANGVEVSAGRLDVGSVSLSGGGLALGDSDKVICGNGDDLEVYHDGAESYVKNTNSNSNLILESAHGVDIKHGGEVMAKFRPDGAVELYHDNVKKMETSSVGVTMNDTVITNGEIRPASDNNHSIGRSNRRYITYFGVNGSINTSDKNEKNTIIDSDLGLDFINKLKPKSYKWNKDDGKTHYGLIAQDLEETLTSLGKTIADFGGIYKEPDSPMGLGYSELIAPLIKAMQELTAKVEALEAV